MSNQALQEPVKLEKGMSVKNIVPISMRSEIECVHDIIITPEESIGGDIKNLQTKHKLSDISLHLTLAIISSYLFAY
jgi:hypothetical protein